MRTVFHSEARQELRDAVAFYAQCQQGLERRFLEYIRAALLQVSSDPLRCRLIGDGIRRCLVSVFPYAVLYAVHDDKIFIVAIMHCHRAPGYWRHRNLG